MIVIGINPLIEIGPFSIRWYVLILFFSIFIGLTWVWKQRGSLPFKRRDLFSFLPLSLLGGVVGSRLIHVLDYWDYYRENPALLLGLEGQSIYGAVLGGALASWLWCKYKGVSFLRTADVISPGLLLAQAFGRLGCIIQGCCYGTPTTLPWGFVYTHSRSSAPLNSPGHPAVVYEIMWNILLFFFLSRIRGTVKEGLIFTSYLLLYAFGRFFINFFRVQDPFIAGLHQAQFISLLILACGIPFMVYTLRRA